MDRRKEPRLRIEFPVRIWGVDRMARPFAEVVRVPSRPGEFHPEPLTDPDLNLSIHPARAIR